MAPIIAALAWSSEADKKREGAMASAMSRVRSTTTQDTAAERSSRLYVDVRASYGRASIQTALLLNGGASIACWHFWAISANALSNVIGSLEVIAQR
jgi:hypothetical protein